MARPLPALLAPVLALGVLPAGLSAAADDVRTDRAAAEFFEARVRPVLVENCVGCHNAQKQKGGLRLDSREAAMKGGDSGPALAPGDPASSRLVEAIGYEGDVQMPPKGKLRPREVEALTEWVKMGAPWPSSSAPAGSAAGASTPQPPRDPRDHWAFRPVTMPAVPAVRDRGWTRGPVDAFVLARLESKGLRPVEEADRRTLIRRLSFDLTGLPPEPDEVDAFVADTAPDAYDRLVDRLLASPHYGERWGRHWLDVARYGEDQAHTFEARRYPNGYRYRDWVIRSLNNDLPYDRFVTEQIAGDLVDGPETEKDGRLAALGFFALGPVYYGKAIADELDDRVDTFCRGFLGLTVACARCHDHKYDPIPTTDYYALAGVFASTSYKEYPAAPADVIRRFEEGQEAVKKATADVDAFLLLSSVRPLYVLPKGQVESALKPSQKTSLRALRAAAAKAKKDAPPPYPVVHSLTESAKPANLRVHVRGNPETLGAEVPRRFLSALAGPEAPAFREGSGRRELARSVVDPANPLTARVFVNRVWEHHFGRGLVATPSNFGTLGEPPTHPELLDYLAARFVAQGWSVKKLHREILLSSTYRLSSRIDPKNQEADADNTLLWRMNRRRLEVEAWRDAMLAVSGELDPTVGGASQELASPANRRRTLYAVVSRHNLDGLLRLFDFPDPNLTADKRVVTSVPLQQLFVLNSEFMVRQARALARRLTSASNASDTDRVRKAYRLLFGRPATDEEVRWGADFVAGGGPEASTPGGSTLTAWEQYAQALLGSNEFAFVD